MTQMVRELSRLVELSVIQVEHIKDENIRNEVLNFLNTKN